MSYLKAEFYRFTRKKSYLFLMGLFTIGYTFISFLFRKNADDIFLFSSMLVQLSPVFIGIASFIMVYGDDNTGHTTQMSIGYGISRTKLVCYKIIEMMILSALVYAYALLLTLVLKVTMNTGLDIKLLMKPIGISMVSIFFYTSVAGLIAFINQKNTMAITMFVLLGTNIIDSLLELVLSIRTVANLLPTVREYLPYVLTQGIYQNGFQLDNAGILIVYGLVALTITVILFRKSELEF